MLRWTGTALAAGLMLAAGNPIWADDVVRLGGSTAQSSIQGGTDMELVRGFHGGGHHGGFYGGRGYYGGGYYGGRSYYGGGYYNRGYGYGGGYYGTRYYFRAYYGYGYGLGGYYGVGGYGLGGYGYSSYYSTPYYGSYYNYGCAGQVAPVMTLQAPTQQYAPSYASPIPQPYMPPANQTPGNYPYDGGPNEQVPMPVPGVNNVPAPSIIPMDGKLVSLPSGISGGFSPVSLTPQPRTNATPRTNSVPRVDYPAYGESR